MKGFFLSLSARRKKTPWAHERKINSGTAGNQAPQEMPLHQTATALHEGGSLWTCERKKTRTHAQTKEMRVHSADKKKKSTVGNNFLWLEESNWIWNGDKASSSALNVYLCYTQPDSKSRLKSKALWQREADAKEAQSKEKWMGHFSFIKVIIAKSLFNCVLSKFSVIDVLRQVCQNKGVGCYALILLSCTTLEMLECNDELHQNQAY